MNNKKCWAKNWESGEKIHLISLVKNKKKLSIAVETMEKLSLLRMPLGIRSTRVFQQSSGNRKTQKELVGQWKRVRIAAKKEATHFYKESASTGGVPPPPPLSNATQLVQQMCPQDSMSMLNPYDDELGMKSQAAVSAEAFLDHSQGFDNVELALYFLELCWCKSGQCDLPRRPYCWMKILPEELLS